MSEELKFEFNDYIIAIDEPYENDYGCVAIGKKQSNGINIVFKSVNEKTVNWFIELQKYISDLQSQLDQANERLNKKDEEFGRLSCDYKTLLSHYNVLKEKAIVPKFKVGQNIFFIDNECQIAQGVVDVILTGQDVFEKWCKYSIDLGVEYEDDIRFIYKDEEEIFATKEEAQAKLKEIQGE